MRERGTHIHTHIHTHAHICALQAVYARTWAAAHVAEGALPPAHATLYKQLMYDPNSGHERKLNRLAKRKVRLRS